MRHFAHSTSAHEDPKIGELLDEHGPAIYGVYWIINEAIARPFSPEKPELVCRRSLKRWANLCRVRAPLMQKMLAKLSELDLLDVAYDPPYVDIKNNKIAKYADEYTKKVWRQSGLDTDEVRTGFRLKRSKEKLREVKPPLPPSAAAPSGGAPATGGEPPPEHQTEEQRAETLKTIREAAASIFPNIPRTNTGEKY